MTRILIRSGKDPLVALPAEAMLGGNVFAGNTGNLVYTQSVHEALCVPGVELVSNGYLHDRMEPPREMIARINAEFDAFVVPLANAFRPAFRPELRRMTTLVRGLRIPVVVVGVGAQTATDATALPPAVREDAAAFLSAVLDRSATVGVRGEITRRCLAALGFGDEHVDVIGCPSLFAPGRCGPVRRGVEVLTPEASVAANLTLSQPRMGRILERAMQDYRGLTYIPQTRDELRLLVRGEPVPGELDATMPTTVDHPLHRTDRVRMFLDPITWYAFLRTQDFSFGTRLHGNIAALLAGTPAFLLTFDSRTSEVAEHHGIPHAPLRSVAADVDPAELYERTDLAAFNAGRAPLLDHFSRFLERNGLAHVHQTGNDNPVYRHRLAGARLPAAVSARSSRRRLRPRLARRA